MIKRERFHDLLREIVEAHYPEEVVSFDLSGKILVDKIYSGHDVLDAEKWHAEFEFADTANAVLGFVASAYATYQLLSEIKNRTTSLSLEQVSERWRTDLKRMGVEEDVRVKLVSEFSNRIIELAKDGE